MSIAKNALLLTASAVFCVGLPGSPLFVAPAFAAPQQAQAAARPDADIQNDVALALSQSSQLQGQQITAATILGDVTLSGTVRDDASKQLAQQIAAGVNGVRSVENNLTLGNIPAQQSQSGNQQTE